MKTWEYRIRKEFGIEETQLNFRRHLLELFEETPEPLKKVISMPSRKILYALRENESSAAVILRHFMTRMFPFDPLRNEPALPIEMVLLTSPKDLDILPLSILSSIGAISNEITRISILCPESIVSEVNQIQSRLTDLVSSPITVITDEGILFEADLASFAFVSTVAKMEVLKVLVGLRSSMPALIVDGDTLLLRPRNWFSRNRQVTPIAQEYFLGHRIFSKKLLGDQKYSGYGFVTHHSLFIPEVVQRIVKQSGGIFSLVSRINSGIRLGWDITEGFPSEWQLYGDYIWSGESEYSPVAANFSNIGFSRSLIAPLPNGNLTEVTQIVEKIRKINRKLGSISLHDYKS
jgi:hypothetical protein